MSILVFYFFYGKSWFPENVKLLSLSLKLIFNYYKLPGLM